jgi:hypothetical protein
VVSLYCSMLTRDHGSVIHRSNIRSCLRSWKERRITCVDPRWPAQLPFEMSSKFGPLAKVRIDFHLHCSHDHREDVSGNDYQRWDKGLERHAHRVYCRGVVGRHAQAEQYHQDLAKLVCGKKHRIYKPTDISVSVAFIPARNKRRRYCCCGAEALESNL